jgi:hypothetical protein
MSTVGGPSDRSKLLHLDWFLLRTPYIVVNDAIDDHDALRCILCMSAEYKPS